MLNHAENSKQNKQNDAIYCYFNYSFKSQKINFFVYDVNT